MAPTDRSNWPPIMSRVTPTATIPNCAARLVAGTNVAVLRKSGVAKLKMTKAATTPASDASSGRMAARRSLVFHDRTPVDPARSQGCETAGAELRHVAFSLGRCRVMGRARGPPGWMSHRCWRGSRGASDWPRLPPHASWVAASGRQPRPGWPPGRRWTRRRGSARSGSSWPGPGRSGCSARAASRRYSRASSPAGRW